MPGLVVTVAIGNTADTRVQLEAGDLDVVLLTLPAPTSRTLSTSKLLADPLMALLSEG
jgi:DNA-binding transcriptional LysR family regulator